MSVPNDSITPPTTPPKDVLPVGFSPMKRYAFAFWTTCMKKGYDIKLPEFREKALAHVIEKTDISYTTAEHWLSDFIRMDAAVRMNLDDNLRYYTAIQAKLVMEAQK